MAVLLWQFDWRYVLVTAITVVVYMYYTYIATEWRIEIRRKMNDSDTEANTKAIDSLLNYETVKYFSAEQREAARYDRSMERYEHDSVKTYTSLAVLNTGQAVIFTARPHRDHADVRARRPQRHQYGRRFRHGQRHDDPALPAAEFHGHGLSRDQAGDHRHREDVQRAGAQSRDQGYPGRDAAGRELGQCAFRRRALCL